MISLTQFFAGEMLNKLESGEVDIALTVTDGFIAGKAKGRNVSLVGTYVESPLIWAIATSGKRKDIDMMKLGEMATNPITGPCRFGASRLGSGSHTMGFYASMLSASLYFESTKKIKEMDMEVVMKELTLEFTFANNFKGLRDGKRERV
jgi:hypothetical protein